MCFPIMALYLGADSSSWLCLILCKKIELIYVNGSNDVCKRIDKG